MKRLVIIMIALFAGGITVNAGTHPNVFLNTDEIEAIKAKVSAGQEPWKSAYAKMLSDANSALSQSPLSVTFTGSSSHDYYTMKPYDWSNNMPSPCGNTRCDGQVNPEADREDYTTATKFGKAVRSLGLGYAFTGQNKYADKALDLIYTFCLDPETYMTPKYFGAQGIEQFITFPGVFYGADLIYNYPGWNADDKADFLEWVEDFGATVVSKHFTNNWEDWRQVFIASAGVLCDKSSFVDNAFSKFKADLESHIGSSGQMTKELSRTKSLSYSTYALLAMTEVAEIARHQGVDLYGYTSNGRNLELAWDYHAPYLLNPSSWPKEQISAYTGENSALYEMANMVEPKSKYLQVINKYKRPMYESRIMGYTTLSHAAGLDVTPVVATPVISPDGGIHTGTVEVTISCATSGAEILYTTNGSTPTASSTKYTGTITLGSTKTIKAKAYKSGLDPSGVASASFTVTADNAAPRITGVSTGGNPTRVVVRFDEELDNSTATDETNYRIPGLSITGAILDGNTVTLTVTVMIEGTEYTLTVSGIKDLAAGPNTMGSMSLAFTFNESFVDDFDANRLSWTVTTAAHWSVEADGIDKSYHITTSEYSSDGTHIPGEMALVNGLAAGEFELSVDFKSPESESGNDNRDCGVVFGYEDADNFWYLLANAAADNNQLFKVAGGRRTEKLNVGEALITDYGYHTLKVIVQDGNIGIYLDGVEKGSVSASVVEGRVGVCSYNDEAWFDDFSLTPFEGSAAGSSMPHPGNVEAWRTADGTGDVLYRIDGVRGSGRASGPGILIQLTATGARAVLVPD